MRKDNHINSLIAISYRTAKDTYNYNAIRASNLKYITFGLSLGTIKNIRRFFRWATSRANYPITIVPYLTYGTRKMLYAKGRVLDDKNIRLTRDDTLFDILGNTYKRFATNEKPNVEVTATIYNQDFKSVTDFEGFFKIREEINQLPINQGETNWIDIEFTLEQNDTIAKSQMLIPNKNAEFGIISDIDDTILKTDVSSFLKLKVLYNSFFKNATDRVALKGASPFYQALQSGKSSVAQNPIFYISNSPWNLYNYLRIFLRETKFPKGPVLLRDLALPWQRNYRTEKTHKQREIRNILRTYPNLKFVMLGDSAEHDVTIYSDVAREYPDQVICIYLHTTKKKSQMNYVQSVVSASKHVQIVLVNNALQAAEHAVELNLISESEYANLKENFN